MLAQSDLASHSPVSCIGGWPSGAMITWQIEGDAGVTEAHARGAGREDRTRLHWSVRGPLSVGPLGEGHGASKSVTDIWRFP
jgi:hypothetical protein